MDQDTGQNDKYKATGQVQKNNEGPSEKAKVTYGRIPRDNTQEEMAEEMTADDFQHAETVDETQDKNDTIASGAIGWIGLALSVLSFFMVPIIFGGGGIIMGFAAKVRDAEILGNSAIITGAASIIITMFVAPFV